MRHPDVVHTTTEAERRGDAAGGAITVRRPASAGFDLGEELLERFEQYFFVELIAEGHTSKQIAAQLVISHKTVERHRANVLAKLGMRDRTELTRYAVRAGLIEP